MEEHQTHGRAVDEEEVAEGVINVHGLNERSGRGHGGHKKGQVTEQQMLQGKEMEGSGAPQQRVVDVQEVEVYSSVEAQG